MSADARLVMSPAHDTVLAYHQRSKHRLQRYADGPETLDWDAQPDPFRRWVGAPLVPLPLVADELGVRWRELHDGVVPPQPMTLRSIGALFELSFALTAWKQLGPDRWALRANPSSGNLHPTEAYLLCAGIEGLADGLYHYAPREHAVELRAGRPPGPPQLWVGLSSVQWREAWKYGERAFRYCQLDVGHAVGALRYAAAALGWQLRVQPALAHAELAALLGLDRADDFGAAEAEEPELLLQIGPSCGRGTPQPAPWPAGTRWHGQANRLDAHPMYRWPVIDEVSRVTQQPAGDASAAHHEAPAAHRPACASLANPLAATLIRQRRSAQQFDRRAHMPLAAFFRIAAALLPQAGVPWDAWPHGPRVHAVLYVHRVEGLMPGAYLLARSAEGAALLAEALYTGQPWQLVTDAPIGLPLYRIAEHAALAGALRTLSCHQAIAGDACFAVSLLGEFEPWVGEAPWRYRELLQEAGLTGQVLYLQAEAEGLRGTGIGCYFDDAVHELLGLNGQRVQAVYHFTVGQPMPDMRIATTPPYMERA